MDAVQGLGSGAPATAATRASDVGIGGQRLLGGERIVERERRVDRRAEHARRHGVTEVAPGRLDHGQPFGPVAGAERDADEAELGAAGRHLVRSAQRQPVVADPGPQRVPLGRGARGAEHQRRPQVQRELGADHAHAGGHGVHHHRLVRPPGAVGHDRVVHREQRHRQRARLLPRQGLRHRERERSVHHGELGVATPLGHDGIADLPALDTVAERHHLSGELGPGDRRS